MQSNKSYKFNREINGPKRSDKLYKPKCLNEFYRMKDILWLYTCIIIYISIIKTYSYYINIFNKNKCSYLIVSSSIIDKREKKQYFNVILKYNLLKDLLMIIIR